MTKLCKCLVIGDGAAGKTTMLKIFTEGTASAEYFPPNLEPAVKEIKIDNEPLLMHVVDTPGQMELGVQRVVQYPMSSLIVICFSIGYRAGFTNVKQNWAKEARSFCPLTPFILVGLKKDLRSDPATSVSYEEGLEMAKSIGAVHYAECSSKTPEEIDKVFESVGRIFLSRILPRRRSICTIL